MKKIEAIIRHERLQEVQDALDQLGVSGLTVSEVVGCGRQKGYTEQYRGQVANISLLPKIKVESVVPSDLADAAVEAIVAAAPHRSRRRRPRVRLRRRAVDPHQDRRVRRGQRPPRGARRLGPLSSRPNAYVRKRGSPVAAPAFLPRAPG